MKGFNFSIKKTIYNKYSSQGKITFAIFSAFVFNMFQKILRYLAYLSDSKV